MARCKKCNSFMLLPSETGFCKKCSTELISQMFSNDSYIPDPSNKNYYPHVREIKKMFDDFFPKFRENVVRNDDAYLVVNQENLFWAKQANEKKHEGQYVEACNLYFSNILQNGGITLGWAKGIFKSLAVAGDFADALTFGREWINYAIYNPNEKDQLIIHYLNLIQFIENPEFRGYLSQYLQTLSGNPDYTIDLDKTDLESAEVKNHISQFGINAMKQK